MKTSTTFGLAGLLFTSVIAVPLAAVPHMNDKRDLVTIVSTAVVTDISTVTQVVWVDEDGVPQTTQNGDIEPPAPSTTLPSVTVANVPSFRSVVQSSSPVATIAPSTPVALPTSSTSQPAPIAPQTITVVPIPAATSSAVVMETPSSVAPLSTAESQVPVPQTSSAPAPVVSAASAGSTGTGSSPLSGKSFTGELTYYDVGLGSCGITSSPGEMVLAISHTLFDQYTPGGNPNKNSLCGSKLQISFHGQTVEATVVDRCESCDENHIDLSEGLFTKFADTAAGVVQGVTWTWM